MWNKNERNGRVDQVKGQAKQAAGKLTGDKDLAARGKVDVAVGKTKVAVGGVQKKVGAAIETLAKKVKR